MTEVTKGAFETSQNNLRSILNWTLAPFDERYEQAWFNLSEDELRTIANAGEAIASYGTYRGDYAMDIDIHDSVDSQAGMEAIVNGPDLQTYLDFVGGSHVRIEFLGEEEDRLASKMRIDGDLTAEIYLPSSKSDIESKQLGIANLYDSMDRFVKMSTFNPAEESADEGEPLSTSFVTTVEEMNRIVNVSDSDKIALSNYPVVVENGELRLSAEDENQRNSINGTLNATDVQGEDVDNIYSRGFQELFSSISGKIEVRIEQDAPISIVYSSEDGDFINRYSILPAA